MLTSRMQDGSRDRRVHTRVTHTFDVLFDDGQQASGINVSIGGLLCITAEPWWPGNVLAFQMHLDADEPLVRMTGQVVELVPYGKQVAMRVIFADAMDNDRRRLGHWLGRRVLGGMSQGPTA